MYPIGHQIQATDLWCDQVTLEEGHKSFLQGGQQELWITSGNLRLRVLTGCHSVSWFDSWLWYDMICIVSSQCIYSIDFPQFSTYPCPSRQHLLSYNNPNFLPKGKDWRTRWMRNDMYNVFLWIQIHQNLLLPQEWTFGIWPNWSKAPIACGRSVATVSQPRSNRNSEASVGYLRLAMASKYFMAKVKKNWKKATFGFREAWAWGRSLCKSGAL